MPTLNGVELAPVSYVTTLAQRVKTSLDTLNGQNFGGVTVADGKINFFATNDTTGTPLATVDLPEEMFLDQVKTTFVQSFAFSTATYPGATNPNLDGKPVFVLAVKGDKTTNPTLTYSFIDLSALVDTYTAKDNSIVFAGTSFAVNFSTVTGNQATVDSSGVFVGHDGTKIDTVAGTADNLVVFGANGAIADGGFSIAAIDARGKVDTISAVAGNIVVFGENGAIVDSGYTVASESGINSILDSIFGAAGGN